MASNFGITPIQPTQQPALDPKVKALASAILTKESRGDYQAKGGSGEYGAYQFMPGTWKAWAGKHLGDPNAPLSVENQNKVAYSQIKEWKDGGLNPAQIASKWNSGNENAYKQNHVGINSAGVAYDTPKYVADVSAIYKKKISTDGLDENKPEVISSLTAKQQLDMSSAQAHGAFFPASTEQPSAIGEAMKTVGNVPKSAFNFIKGALGILNPMNTVKSVKEAITGFKDFAKESGDSFSAFDKTIKEIPGAAYEMLVPEAAKGLVTAGKGAFAGNQQAIDEGLQKTQREITNDPVGQIAPFLMLAKGAAKAADTVANKNAMRNYVGNIRENIIDRKPIPKPQAKYSGAFDTAIEKTAGVVIKPMKTVFGGMNKAIGDSTRYAAGQATGLQPSTISEVIKNPESFTREARGKIERSSLGREVQSTLNKKAKELKETGEIYKPIRESAGTVLVDPKFVDNIITELAGMKIKKGKMQTSGGAVIREAKDVHALQHVYDIWKPVFKKGEITNNEFLNFREDLAEMSKFERQIGKSKPLEDLSKIARARFNQAYRPQVKGLGNIVDAKGNIIQKGLDSQFSAQQSELNRLRKGFVDGDGNLTDSAINRIANSTGKGKDLPLGRLEEIVPGVTQKVKILKAVEDIENASGIKVGTYTRAALIGGGLFTGGPVTAIVNAILTSPELAVPILRRYGMLKNSNVIKTVIQALKSGVNTINQTPNNAKKILQKDIKDIPAGLSIKDVPGGVQQKTPSGAFSKKEVKLKPKTNFGR